ncbi:MAG: CvpA family protein [Treponema sp.]|jgi:membrane protein required for colicin V production|nr:CvpA family protein [Treponema sp.]
MRLANIDIVFAVLTVILIVRASLRGFVEEFMAMASLVLGILGAVIFYKNAGLFIRERYMPEVQVIPEILGFLILFLIIYILIKILAHILEDIIQRINLGGVNHFLGFLFGIVEGLTLVSLILAVLIVQPLFNSGPLLGESYFARFLLPLIGMVKVSWGASGV